MLQQSGMPRGEGSARLQAESTYSGTEPLIASLIQAGRRSSPRGEMSAAGRLGGARCRGRSDASEERFGLFDGGRAIAERGGQADGEQ